MKMAKTKTNLNVDFHVYTGTVRGAIAYSECKKDKKATYELKELDGEVTALEWGHSNDEILIGNKSGAVKIYNTGLSKYVTSLPSTEFEGKDSVVGLGVEDRNIIIGRKDGTINIYNISRKKNKNNAFKLNLIDDATVNVMVYNQTRNVIATGGEKNDLKIWDITRKTDVFKAKSMGKDELELPIPTSVRGICFFKEDNVVACATKEGMVLLYDERAQRRPIKKLQEPKASFTTVTSYRERSCFVGTTKGYMQLIDMRQEKCVKTFQACAGAVTSIVCDDNEPYVVSTSLDKHLRIHHVDTKELVHKEYMKIGLTKVLMRPVAKDEPKEEENAVPVDEEYEGLFETMETINDDDENDNVQVVTKRKKTSKVKSPTNKRKSA